eukprot:CAMPEP_0179088824 /NCGR_PEP_ID=MMETSP0796-20121207/40438_1 /TAXON_ID=73915 /ORGANISM="Pyrodinium bahamense, Strain pbaha01" /LENGTH=212 /DNA_ID=CAMNT_0020786365 /DNA_START=38 /DNA_END=673 /DNA_ORIENTATION=-
MQRAAGSPGLLEGRQASPRRPLPGQPSAAGTPAASSAGQGPEQQQVPRLQLGSRHGAPAPSAPAEGLALRASASDDVLYRRLGPAAWGDACGRCSTGQTSSPHSNDGGSGAVANSPGWGCSPRIRHTPAPQSSSRGSAAASSPGCPQDAAARLQPARTGVLSTNGMPLHPPHGGARAARPPPSAWQPCPGFPTAGLRGPEGVRAMAPGNCAG